MPASFFFFIIISVKVKLLRFYLFRSVYPINFTSPIHLQHLTLDCTSMARDLRTERIQQERKQWRKDHPFGFYAKPTKAADGSLDLHNWTAGVPGKQGTIWENATYPLTISFPEDYPAKPPKVRFPSNFYHPNVYPSGTICLSILNEEQDWRPAISIKQLLMGIQELLDTPNPNSPAQEPAWRAFQKSPEEYEKRVKAQKLQYSNKN